MALMPYYASAAEGVADFAADVVRAKGDGDPRTRILNMYAIKAMDRYLYLARFKPAEAEAGRG